MLIRELFFILRKLNFFGDFGSFLKLLLNAVPGRFYLFIFCQRLLRLLYHHFWKRYFLLFLRRNQGFCGCFKKRCENQELFFLSPLPMAVRLANCMRAILIVSLGFLEFL